MTDDNVPGNGSCHDRRLLPGAGIIDAKTVLHCEFSNVQVLASLICQTVGGLLGAGMIDRQGRKPVLQAGAGVRLTI